MRSKRRPPRSNGTTIASRVVPGWSNATSRSSPSQALISVDLPTLGRPATASRIGASASICSELNSASPASGSSAELVAERCRQCRLGERDDALSVRRRDRVRRAEAELVDLAQQRRFGHAFGLVGSDQNLLPRAAQVTRDVVVVGRDAGAQIDDEDDRVGLGDGLLGLARHLAHDAGRVLGLEAAGIDDDELVPADLRVAVVAIARQAGEVGDDRVARLGQAIEERRLADVRPADQGDDGLHEAVAATLAGLRRDGRRTRRPIA